MDSSGVPPRRADSLQSSRGRAILSRGLISQQNGRRRASGIHLGWASVNNQTIRSESDTDAFDVRAAIPVIPLISPDVPIGVCGRGAIHTSVSEIGVTRTELHLVLFLATSGKFVWTEVSDFPL